MHKMIRNTKRALGAIRTKAGLAVVASGAMVVTSPAFADTGLGTIISTEMTSAKPELIIVMGAIIGVLVLLLVFTLIKAAMRK